MHGSLVGFGIPAFAVVIGLIAWRFGARGRAIDDHPVCRRCAFDLSGLPAGHERCPVCGAILSGSRAVRVGNRLRRRFLIACGKLLLITGLAALAVLGRRAWQNTDWMPLKPAWLLRHEAFAANRVARDLALAELAKRLDGGKLSAEQVDAVVLRVLGKHGDHGQAWDTAWGDWLQAARKAGKVPDERWQRYMRQSFVVELEVRPEVRRGDPIPLLVRSRPEKQRTGQNALFHPLCDAPLIRIGDQPAERAQIGALNFDLTNPRRDFPRIARPAEPSLSTLREGRQPVRLILPVRFHELSPVRRNAFASELTLSANFVLTPADQPTVALRSDPEPAGALTRSIFLHPIIADAEDRPRRARCSLTIKTAPSDLSYDVFVVRAGTSRYAGGFVVMASEEQEVHFHVPLGTFSSAGPIDIILRPSLRAAAETVSITRIRPESLRFPNVTVLRGDGAYR